MSPSDKDLAAAQDAALTLFSYCRAQNWAGYDPYDALNSRIFRMLPFLDTRLPRLALTQLFKRAPFNLRPLLLVPKTQNAKGLALFLKATLKLSRLQILEEAGLVDELVETIGRLRSDGSRFSCWGYSFPWQTRARLVPVGTPNLVCTTFVAEALLDLYEATGRGTCLELAVGAADYLLKELYWTEGNGTAAFAYPLPSSRIPVHNANLLASAFLCRLAALIDNQSILDPALKVARYSAGRQQSDGSWLYGEGTRQAWIDNFHTGYNLCALRDIGLHTRNDEFEDCLARGFQFYRDHFLRPDGAPKYFHDRTYPLDVHSAAQSIITLVKLTDLDQQCLLLARNVLNWTLANLRDAKGYFYYQKQPWGKIRIPYMRWGQAWMLLALATFLEGDYPAGFTSISEPCALAMNS